MYQKPYEKLEPKEKEKVNLAASNKMKACLFLMLSRNNQGTKNSALLKEKHNQYLGDQDTYPPDMAQAVRQVTDYCPVTVGTVSSSALPSLEPLVPLLLPDPSLADCVGKQV